MRLPLLLVAVVVVAGSFAFADDNVDESKAIKQIELLGGKVWRDDGYPPDRSVTGVDFHGNKNLNQNELHILKSFKYLKSLNLNDTKINDAGLTEISELIQLDKLWLIGTELPLDGPEKLALSLSNTKRYFDIPDEEEAIENIPFYRGTVLRDDKLPGLPIVQVGFNRHTRITPDDLQYLKAFKRLTTLSLSGEQTKGDLAGFSELKRLTTLNLSGNYKPTALGLMELSKLPHLTTLYLDNAIVADGSLVGIGELKNLTSLNLRYAGIRDGGLKGVSELENLTDLNLEATQITDAALYELRELKNLKNLNLYRCRITDEGLKILSQLEDLTTLDLTYARISDEGLSRLKELKNLSTLNLTYTLASDFGLLTQSGLKQLKEFKILKKLTLSEITIEEYQELQRSLPNTQICIFCRCP